jgi:hypothetical protein
VVKRDKPMKKRTVKGHGVDVVDLEPSSKIWFINVKEIFHPFSYVGRDTLKLSMLDPIFSGVLSERRFVFDVMLIHKFT